MAVRIPTQRTEPTESPETTTHRECAVEECDRPGELRYFPHYRLTLCTDDFVRVADEHRARGAFW